MVVLTQSKTNPINLYTKAPFRRGNSLYQHLRICQMGTVITLIIIIVFFIVIFGKKL